MKFDPNEASKRIEAKTAELDKLQAEIPTLKAEAAEIDAQICEAVMANNQTLYAKLKNRSAELENEIEFDESRIQYLTGCNVPGFTNEDIIAAWNDVKPSIQEKLNRAHEDYIKALNNARKAYIAYGNVARAAVDERDKYIRFIPGPLYSMRGMNHLEHIPAEYDLSLTGTFYDDAELNAAIKYTDALRGAE